LFAGRWAFGLDLTCVVVQAAVFPNERSDVAFDIDFALRGVAVCCIASVMQRPLATQTRQHPRRQARHSSKAAVAAHPAMPESRHAASGFSPFTYPNATRTARAAFRFDTGHSL
jgi:hypothetical protein